MRSTFLLSLGLATIMATPLYAASTDTSPTAPTTQENAQNQSDGEIIGVLVVLNKNEIAAAKQAMKKSKTSSVKQYASMLKNEHSKNLSDTLALSKKMGVNPVESATVITLKKEGKDEVMTLTTLNGQEFENAYINAMVKDHATALSTIDNNLLKNVSNPDLKAHLDATRTHIASHLEQGQNLQSTLKTTTTN